MERKIIITYHWKCNSFPKGIPKPLANVLEESAEERIFEMRGQGYTSGELHDNVTIDIPGRKTPGDGYECHGWFDIKVEE